MKIIYNSCIISCYSRLDAVLVCTILYDTTLYETILHSFAKSHSQEEVVSNFMPEHWMMRMMMMVTMAGEVSLLDDLLGYQRVP
jgi:hypothetical protein